MTFPGPPLPPWGRLYPSYEPGRGPPLTRAGTLISDAQPPEW